MKNETTHNTSQQRTAYSLAEVAAMFGRHRSWTYRLVRSGKIKSIVGFGRELIPIGEINRILSLTQADEEGLSPDRKCVHCGCWFKSSTSENLCPDCFSYNPNAPLSNE